MYILRLPSFTCPHGRGAYSVQRIRASACDSLRKMQTTLEPTERGEEDERYREGNGSRKEPSGEVMKDQHL